MDIHVHFARVHRDIEEERRSIARMDCRAVAGFGGAHEERIAKRPPVDEQLGAPAGRLGVGGSLRKPGHVHSADRIIDGDECANDVAAPHRGEAFIGVLLGWYHQARATIERQLESRSPDARAPASR